MKSFHQGTSLGHTSIIQAQPFPVVILHSSLEAVRMGVAPQPSPAHHSPLSLRRSQGNSGAVQGTRHLHVGKWSPHTSAFSAPPPAPGLLRTTTPTLRPPFPALMGQNKSSAVKSSFALSTQVLQLPRKPPENTGRSLLHVPGAPVSLKLHNPPCLTATPTLPGHGRV